jgi:long-chain acyl-CoA synthetase
MIKMSDATGSSELHFGLALKIGRKRADLVMHFKPVPLPVQCLLYLVWPIGVFRKLKERLGFERIRVAYSGAAPIAPDVLQFFQSIGINLIEGYGQTEGHRCHHLVPHRQVKFGYGRARRCRNGYRLPKTVKFWCGPPAFSKGITTSPESTKETIVDGWLHTGDVGEIDEDGLSENHGPQKRHYRHRRRKEHHAPVYRKQAQGKYLHQ